MNIIKLEVVLFLIASPIAAWSAPDCRVSYGCMTFNSGDAVCFSRGRPSIEDCKTVCQNEPDLASLHRLKGDSCAYFHSEGIVR